MTTRVYFQIKANSTGYWHYIDVPKTTVKNACVWARVQVMNESGRNAFTPFCCPRDPKDYERKIMEHATPWDPKKGF